MSILEGTLGQTQDMKWGSDVPSSPGAEQRNGSNAKKYSHKFNFLLLEFHIVVNKSVADVAACPPKFDPSSRALQQHAAKLTCNRS